MTTGSSTAAGTLRYSMRFDKYLASGFYRNAQERAVSTLGLGTYLGGMDDAADQGYTEAVLAALEGGINLIDTSLNYRHQRSERAIGAALRQTSAKREEYVVCTKAGYLVPGALPPEEIRARALQQGQHSMEPDFLLDQLERSRENLGLDAIDVFYLHNPEAELAYVAPDEFYRRIARAFETLERCAADGKILGYGAATWDGFRMGQLDLRRMHEAAVAAGGARHRFRWIQLPVNLAMLEALRGDLLRTAAELEITVIASASLLQKRLLAALSDDLVQLLARGGNAAQAAIQFTRSAPGVTAALVGMGQRAHVEQNLGVARIPPLTADAFQTLFQRA